MFRYFTALAVFLLLFTFANQAAAQACGGSTRTIKLEYPAGAKAPKTVDYQLYFLMPKTDIEGDWKKQAEFIADFLYGKHDQEPVPFWHRYDNGTTFFEVPAVKAEAYIAKYRQEDFAFIYTSTWREHVLAQLHGQFTGGILRLRTGETDGTTYIMKVTAEGYKTQYLLNDFLGGCHYNYTTKNGPDPAQKIVMQKGGK